MNVLSLVGKTIKSIAYGNNASLIFTFTDGTSIEVLYSGLFDGDGNFFDLRTIS